MSRLLHLLQSTRREWDRLLHRALFQLGLELGPAPAGPQRRERP